MGLGNHFKQQWVREVLPRSPALCHHSLGKTDQTGCEEPAGRTFPLGQVGLRAGGAPRAGATCDGSPLREVSQRREVCPLDSGCCEFLQLLCFGLNCVPPPNFHVAALTPGPQNVTAFGNRVFEEVIKVQRGPMGGP